MSLSMSDDRRRIPLAPCPDCNNLMPEEQERCQRCDALKGNYVKVSEAAIERAAKAMLDAMYDDKTLKVDDEDRSIIRAVVAALREGA